MINEERRKLQMEALSALEDHDYRGIVILPTGTGKSFILTECLRRLYKPGMSVLYTCDSVRLRDTDFNKELEKWGASDYIHLVDRECYATTYKWEGLEYDILLADEGDYALTPEYCKLFFNNTFKHIIFVSATLSRDKREMASRIAPIVYEKKIKQIEDAKVINKSEFYYVPYLLNSNENAQYVDYNERFRNLLVQPDSDNRKKRLQFLTFERLHFLASLESSAYICRRLIREIEDDSKILVFCGMTEQADKICDSFHTGNAHLCNIDKFNNGDINKLAVCGKIDRGVNLNGVNKAIMENATGSETKMIQKLGRGKRLEVDEYLRVYFLVPYFRRYAKASPTPTIILSKIQNACRNMGIEKATTYILKPE